MSKTKAIRISTELHSKIAHLAIDEGVSMYDMAERLIRGSISTSIAAKPSSVAATPARAKMLIRKV